MDTSLDACSVQCAWLPAEAQLPNNILELSPFRLHNPGSGKLEMQTFSWFQENGFFTQRGFQDISHRWGTPDMDFLLHVHQKAGPFCCQDWEECGNPDLVKLADLLWVPSDWPDYLSQGSVHHPASQSLDLMVCWGLRHLRTGVYWTLSSLHH